MLDLKLTRDIAKYDTSESGMHRCNGLYHRTNHQRCSTNRCQGCCTAFAADTWSTNGRCCRRRTTDDTTTTTLCPDPNSMGHPPAVGKEKLPCIKIHEWEWRDVKVYSLGRVWFI